tara:strand:- start:2912 stop:3772 length:861 start_codon:yes stop_codon:yes gene_type:complete
MRALVTGHLGYIGRHLTAALEKGGQGFVGVDLKEGHDLCDGVPDYVDYYDPDVIFHLAAIPRVAYSVENPLHVMRNNIVSTSVVLDYARRNNIPVVYSSSSSVIGNGDGPASPYALSKQVGEVESLLYHKLYGLKTIALRYFNVYSYDQIADSAYATVVCNWKKHIKNPRLTPFITGDGNQRRDMTHVSDIVSANIFCAENLDNDSLWGQWYDVGSGENISLNELKEIVLQYLPEQSFEYVEERKGDVMLTRADLSKFNQHGWKSEIDLETGLNDVYSKLAKELQA